TEILFRHENNLIPAFFSDGLQSITFTNGSMVLEMAELRITQKILLSKYGYWMSQLNNYLLFKNQIISANGNQNLKEKEIQTLWEASTLKNGNKKVHQTI